MILGQTPLSDPTWTLYFEDNFNSAPVNTNKWAYNPPWGNCTDEAHRTNNGSNHDFSTPGSIMLLSKQQNSVCTVWDGSTHSKPYTTGGLFSLETFKYGYFEIRCKIPQLNNSIYTTKGFGPNFWLWPMAPDAYDNTPVTWSEIDIFEIDGDGNKVTNNIHFISTYLPDGWVLRDPDLNNWDEDDFFANFNTFRKLACEWTPNYIAFYYDDKVVQTSYTEYADDLLPMNIFIDINTPASNFGKTFEPNSLFPYPYEVDYVRVYKLQMDCTTDIAQSAFSYLTFDNKVKRNITVGGSGGKVPSGSSASLRATTSITLNDGFEVEIGSEFYANNCDCE